MKKTFFMYVRSFWSQGQVITLMGAFMASFCRFGIFLPTPEAKLFFDQIGDLFQNNALHDPKGVTGHLWDQSDRTCYANITITSARYYCDIIVILLQYGVILLQYAYIITTNP